MKNVGVLGGKHTFNLTLSRKLSFRTSHTGSTSYTRRSGAIRCTTGQQSGQPGELARNSGSRASHPPTPHTQPGEPLGFTRTRAAQPHSSLLKETPLASPQPPVLGGRAHVARSTAGRTRCCRAWRPVLTFREGLQPGRTRESLITHLTRRGRPPREGPPNAISEDGPPI